MFYIFFPDLPSNTSGMELSKIFRQNNATFTNLWYCQVFVILLVSVFLVLVIFTGSREQNNIVKGCFFLLDATCIDLWYFQIFVLLVVMESLVSFILTSNCEQNSIIKFSLYWLMAWLLVTGFFGSNFGELCQL